MECKCICTICGHVQQTEDTFSYTSEIDSIGSMVETDITCKQCDGIMEVVA